MTQQAGYDVVVVGGGAAGLTAGLHACRSGLKTVLLERLMPGGQVVNAEKIENFPGFPDGIFGADFGPLLTDQASRYGLEIALSEVSEVRRDGDAWRLEGYGDEWRSRSVIFAGGSTLRRLGVPGEAELHGAGVSYCATCDGAFFMDQEVGVVGSGDSALDEAVTLTEFASKVTVLSRGSSFSGQKVLQDRALAHPKIEARWGVAVDGVIGEGQVEGVAVTDVASGETSRIDLGRAVRIHRPGPQHRLSARPAAARQRRAHPNGHLDAHAGPRALRRRGHPAALRGAARQRGRRRRDRGDRGPALHRGRAVA